MNSELSKTSAWHPTGALASVGIHRWTWRIAVVAITLAVSACTTVPDQGGGQTIWHQNGSETNYVKLNRVEIHPAPPGARTAGALDISPSQLRSALTELRYRSRDGDEQPVFTDDALDRIVKPLSHGLSQLQAGEDLVFGVTQKRGNKLVAFFKRAKLTTGRMFVTDEGLNVIFGYIDSSFEGTYRVTGVMPELKPGRRNKPANEPWAVLESEFVDYAKPGRDDWIVIEPKAWLTAQPVSRSGEAAGAAPASGMDQPGNQYYRSTRERLQAIKKLHQDGLISDQEYQELRSRILHNLTE